VSQNVTAIDKIFHNWLISTVLQQRNFTLHLENETLEGHRDQCTGTGLHL